MSASRFTPIIALVFVVSPLLACGLASHDETVTKKIVVHDGSDTVEMSVEDLEGDGEGTAKGVDYDGAQEVSVLRYSLIYGLDKTPRESGDIEVRDARIDLLQPDDIDLTIIESVHVYLLPRRATWYDTSDWRRVAVSHAFRVDQRSAHFDILDKPSDVGRYIHSDDGDDEVWLAILVVVGDDLDVPEEDIEVEVDIDVTVRP